MNEKEKLVVFGLEDVKGNQCGLTTDQMRKLSINEDIVDAIQDVFQDMDEDGNGTLSESELGDAMTALGVSYNEEELAAIMKEIDTNGDGQIDFFEFSQMISSKLKLSDPVTDLRKDFAAFDLDGDGSITTQELRTELESLGEHLSEVEITQMMEEADENHDGTVDFEEFCKIWTGKDSGLKVEKSADNLSRTTDHTENDTSTMAFKEEKTGQPLSDTQVLVQKRDNCLSSILK